MEKNILVVDDEEVVLDYIKKALSTQGYTVFTALNAKEALDILKQKDIRVIFLDLRLPEMNGVELCRKIRENQQTAYINVYALTGYASLLENKDCLEAGFNNYFTKPLSLESLIKAAREAFEKIESCNIQ